MRSGSILAIAGAFFGGGSAQAAGSAAMRAEVGGVLKSARCDQCHDSSVSSENARALAVYDLVDADWPSQLTQAQLPKLLTRLKGAPAADRKIVREFIAAELKGRGAAGR
jgi:hypothetical protein